LPEIFDEIKRLSSTGKRVLGCYAPYPPLELFHSLGFIPVVLWEDPSTLAQTILDNSSPGEPSLPDGLFVYNAYGNFPDSPARLEETFSKHDLDIPVFSMAIPMEFSDGEFQDELFAKEIENLVKKIENTFRLRFSGANFFKSVELYRKMRRLAKDAMTMAADDIIPFWEYASTMTKNNLLPIENQMEALSELIAKYRSNPPDENKKHPEILKMRSLIQGDEKEEMPEINGPDNETINSIFTGTVIPSPDILSSLLQAGIRIVGNDLAALTRTIAYTPRGTDDPTAYYVEYYKNHFPCLSLPHTSDNRESGLMEIIRVRDVKLAIYTGGYKNEKNEFSYFKKLFEKEGIETISIFDESFDSQILQIKKKLKR
jgi:2-hydroxyglutaryl-CoA dehydratase, D-component